MPDLIFIHGTGSSNEMWLPQVEEASARGYRSFVLDLRGHGESHEPGETTDLSVHMSDVLETIEACGTGFPAAFVGHSLGAIISVSIAEKRPELTRVVFAAGLPGKILKPMSVAFKLFLNSGYDHIKNRRMHERWAFRPRTLINTERHALEQILENFETLDFLSAPPVVRCPLHIAAGRFDPVAPCHYAVRLHKLLPDSTLKIFEFGGHNFMDTHPKTFNSWLFDGLKSLDSEKVSRGAGSV